MLVGIAVDASVEFSLLCLVLEAVSLVACHVRALGQGPTREYGVEVLVHCMRPRLLGADVHRPHRVPILVAM